MKLLLQQELKREESSMFAPSVVKRPWVFGIGIMAAIMDWAAAVKHVGGTTRKAAAAECGRSCVRSN